MGLAAGLGAFLAWIGGGALLAILRFGAYYEEAVGGAPAGAGDDARFFADAAAVVALVAAVSALPALALGARWPHVLAAGGAVFALTMGGLLLSGAAGRVGLPGGAAPALAPGGRARGGLRPRPARLGARRLRRALAAVFAGEAACLALAVGAAAWPPADPAWWANPLVLACSSWVLLPAVAGCAAGRDEGGRASGA